MENNNDAEPRPSSDNQDFNQSSRSKINRENRDAKCVVTPEVSILIFAKLVLFN